MMLRVQILVQTAVLLSMVMVHGVEGEGPDATTEQVAYVGKNGVLGCPLTDLYTISYPSWSAPNGSVLTLIGGAINPAYNDSVSYATDTTSLVITNIVLSDAGAYKCIFIIDSVNRKGINTLYTRIRPQPSVISNRQSDGTMTGTEGQSLTLTCTSRGGYPEPTVTLFHGSNPSTALTSSNSGSLEGDGYTVTVTYTFSPISSDVGSIYICQTSYTSPNLDVLYSVNARLLLNLKPSQPTVVQDGDVVAGSSVIVRCTTFGFRPEAITISWMYKGGDYSQHATPTQTSGTDTYTATSTLRFPVQKVDNGQMAKCIVAHSTLGTPSTGTTTINVKFPPPSATIEGNMEFEADGHNKLYLTCVVGESNPMSAISWSKTGTVDIGTTNAMLEATGSYGGSTRSQVLELMPKWDDDGDTIRCTADNGVGQLLTDTITLNLKFHPITTVTVSPTRVVTEGQTDVTLQCSAYSKPAPTITWHHNGNPLLGGQLSTTAHNPYVSTYKITYVSRQDAGEYKCIATNTVSQPGDTSNTAVVTLVVQYKPESAAVTDNHVIVANGVNPLTLTCSVGVGNPVATTISWTSSTGTVYPVSTQNTLVLTPTRDDDGDTVTCTAINTIGPVTSAPVTLDLHFHPITTITASPTRVVTDGQTDVTLQCSVHSKPEPTITWYHNANGITLQGGQLTPGPARNTYVSTYKITSVSRQDYGEYKCIATVSLSTGDTSDTAVVTLVVRFPPLSATIEDNREFEADGHNKLQLNCVVGESSPISAITWRRTGTVDIGTIHATQEVTGSYGGHTRSQVLELTPTRDDDGDTITCTAGNGLGQSVTSTITLNLKFSAIASIPRGDETVVEGAPSKDLTCNANSKPAANFKWYKGTSSAALVSGSGTGSGNQWTSTYTVAGVDRSHAGRYRCVAYNGIGAADEKTMALTVNYPPDVTVTATTSDLYMDLACSPSGVPSTYLYSNWEQTWPGYGEITRPLLAAAPTLRLSNLTYADSGIYTCRVSNGVAPYGTNDIIRHASTAAVAIKSHPIITSPSSTENEKLKFAVKLNQPTSVNVSSYSTAEPTLVSCYLVIDAVRQSPSVGTVTTDPTQVDLPVFNSLVPTLGTRAMVTWTIVQEFGLGFYEVVIKNTVGEASVVVEAVIEGPPARPEYFQVTGTLSTSVGVSWLPGFHGGYPQTFVVQYSTDEVTWTDGAALDTGLSTGRDRHHVTVDSLRPGTNYHLRMYAYSQLGASPHSLILNVTTSGVQDGAGMEARASFAEGAAVVAGSVGAVIVVCAIGIAGLYIKGYRIRHTNNADKYSEQAYVNEEMTGSIQAQSRCGVEGTNASVLAKSDDAPGVYEQLPSAGADDPTTYTQLELHESTNRHQEAEEYENMKI